jgi:hypothetical protein
MHHVIGTLLIGVVAGGVAGNRDKRRPLVRRLVKGGIVAKRKLQAAGAAAIAETQKLVDEARAELDQAGTEMHQ